MFHGIHGSRSLLNFSSSNIAQLIALITTSASTNVVCTSLCMWVFRNSP